MKVLFSAFHFAYYRNYESVLCALAERGHQVHVTADITEHTGGQAIVERVAAAYPDRVTWGFAPPLAPWRWTPFAQRLRYALDHVRFADPQYDPVPKYRTRADVWTPGIVRALCRLPGVNSARGRNLLARALVWLERGLPTCPAMDAFIAEQNPDVVVLASVANPPALQLDHLKSSMAAGRHASISVWSWDHLAGKAWLKIVPEQLLVWNDTLKQEAVTLHGIAPDRVVVTGAQCYDQWFERRPSRDRETFCREVGLDPARPFILYVCSVLSKPAPLEPPFVMEWIRHIRTSADPVLRSAGLLIRPHPERMKEWEGVSFEGFENVAFRGGHPVNADAKADYFDSMYHSAAVMGLVTSASVEAAVVGRPNYTIQLPAYREHQEQSPHFHHLMRAAGGLLYSASSFDEHVAHLSAALSDPATPAARSRRFVEGFVRPNGMDVRATDTFVAALESLAARPAPKPEAFGAPSRRVVVELVRAVASIPGLEWLSEIGSQTERRQFMRDRERRRRVAAFKTRVKGLLGDRLVGLFR